MRRAFLCYSTGDAGIVGTVAKRLGRAKVVYDEMSFEPGQDFREQILAGLDASHLIVFFVSRRSLQSFWCRFELDEAEFRLLQGKLEGHLAIITDPSVSADDLPPLDEAIPGGQ